MKTVEQLAKENGTSTRWERKKCELGYYNTIKISDTWIILEDHDLIVDLRRVSPTLKKLLGCHVRKERHSIKTDLESA